MPTLKREVKKAEIGHIIVCVQPTKAEGKLAFENAKHSKQNMSLRWKYV